MLKTQNKVLMIAAMSDSKLFLLIFGPIARHHILQNLFNIKLLTQKLAGMPRLELGRIVLETIMLPLHHTPVTYSG